MEAATPLGTRLDVVLTEGGWGGRSDKLRHKTLRLGCRRRIMHRVASDTVIFQFDNILGGGGSDFHFKAALFA